MIEQIHNSPFKEYKSSSPRPIVHIDTLVNLQEVLDNLHNKIESVRLKNNDLHERLN